MTAFDLMRRFITYGAGTTQKPVTKADRAWAATHKDHT